MHLSATILAKILIFVFLLFPCSGWAATYYIDYVSGSETAAGTSTATAWKYCPGDARFTTGCINPSACYTTWTTASSTLSPGDKVIFKGGISYLTEATEAGNHKRIEMKYSGSSTADIIYDGDSGRYVARWGSGTDKAIIDGQGTTIIGPVNFNANDISYVTINGFEVKNGLETTTDNEGNGLIYTNTSSGHHPTYITISNNLLHDGGSWNNTKLSAVDPYPAIGFHGGTALLGLGSYWKIYGNVIYDAYFKAINMGNGSYNEIHDNIIYGNVCWAITLADNTTGSTSFTGNKLYNNTIYDLLKDVPQPWNCHSNWFWLFSACGVGETCGFANTSIFNNLMYNASADPVSTGSGFIHEETGDNAGDSSVWDGLYIYNNIMFNGSSTQPGMAISTKGGNLSNVGIYNNTFYSAANPEDQGGAFHLTPVAGYGTVTNLTIKNNVFISDNSASWNIGVPSSGYFSGTMAINRNAYKSTVTNTFTQTGSCGDGYCTFAEWQGLGYDLNGKWLTSTDQFISRTPETFNMRPKVGSDLLNMGENLSSLCSTLTGLCDDINGVPRPVTATWNAGAYATVDIDKMCELQTIPAATGTEYFVATTGSDTTGNGSSGTPWRTIQKCANGVTAPAICTIKPGSYDQYVDFDNATGSAGNYITVRAQYPVLDPGTDVAHRAITQGFKIRNPYCRVEGMDITRYFGTLASFYLYTDAGNTMIVHNLIRDGVQHESSHLTFSASAKTITKPGTESSFIDDGFKENMIFWVGRNIADCYGKDKTTEMNHNFTRTVKTVAANTITIADAESLVDESDVYGVLYQVGATNNYYGIPALYMAISSGLGANNVIIHGNKFTNIPAKLMNISGTGTIIEDNEIEAVPGFEIWGWNGTNTVIQRNYIHDCIRYAGMGNPPEGWNPNEAHGPYWDFFSSFFTSYGSTFYAVNNNTFQCNFVKDNDFELGQVYSQATSGTAIANEGFKYRYNVISGMDLAGAFHRPKTYVYNNTFYKAAYNAAGAVLNVTNSGTSTANDSVIKNNAFVECGLLPDTSGVRGWYGIEQSAYVSSLLNKNPDYDYVAGAVASSYPSKAGFVGKEINGINGGNPSFTDVTSPLGADGIPFTVDDGLKPTTGILCGKGYGGESIGAYNCEAGEGATQYTLTITCSHATVTSDPEGSTCSVAYDYDEDTEVTLSGSCSIGYETLTYSGDCSGSTCVVDMTGGKAVTASCSAIVGSTKMFPGHK